MKGKLFAAALLAVALSGCSDAAKTKADAEKAQAEAAKAKADAEKAKADLELAKLNAGRDKDKDKEKPSQLIVGRWQADADTTRKNFGDDGSKEFRMTQLEFMSDNTFNISMKGELFERQSWKVVETVGKTVTIRNVHGPQGGDLREGTFAITILDNDHFKFEGLRNGEPVRLMCFKRIK